MSRVFIAEKAAIHVYDMDLNTGALISMGEPVDTDGPGSFLALSADGKFLYSIAKPGMAAFSVDPSTSALTHVNSVKCDLSGNSYISVVNGRNGGVALGAAYGGGGINVVKIGADGRLLDAEPGASKQHAGGGSNVYQPATGNEQEAAHPHCCVIDPSGKWALVSDLGQDKIYVYSIDIAEGRLAVEDTISTAPGAGPRHMCFHPNGKWVYGINELDNTVDVYEFGTKDAILSRSVQTISTLPDDYNNRDHGNAKNAAGGQASGPHRPAQTNAAADIRITPDGRFLYGSNRGHDSLVCYSVDDNGRLKLQDFTYVRGEHPRGFNIHPSGDWILVANQDSGNVVVFKIDKETGALTYADCEVPVKTARCIQWANPASSNVACGPKGCSIS